MSNVYPDSFLRNSPVEQPEKPHGDVLWHIANDCADSIWESSYVGTRAVIEIAKLVHKAICAGIDKRGSEEKHRPRAEGDNDALSRIAREGATRILAIDAIDAGMRVSPLGCLDAIAAEVRRAVDLSIGQCGPANERRDAARVAGPELCGNCNFWMKQEGCWNKGRCHRFPKNETAWSTGKCGEWKRRESDGG